MRRHNKRGFLLVVVMLLFSLAVVAEMLTVRYLANLNRHVQHRQTIIQNRQAPPPR